MGDGTPPRRPDDSLTGVGDYYIGENDCKKATCPRGQAFPDSDDPYCLTHSIEEYFSGNHPNRTRSTHFHE